MSNHYTEMLLENLYLEAIEKGMNEEEAQRYAEEESEKWGDLPWQFD